MKNLSERISEIKGEIQQNLGYIKIWEDRGQRVSDESGVAYDLEHGGFVIKHAKKNNGILERELARYSGLNPNIYVNQVIMKYCNMHIGSDCQPYEVVRTVSEKCVEVRAMSHGENKTKMVWHTGGFAGHCSNNQAQEYDYESVPDGEVMKVRFSVAKNQWQAGSLRFAMASGPIYFHDMNF